MGLTFIIRRVGPVDKAIEVEVRGIGQFKIVDRGRSGRLGHRFERDSRHLDGPSRTALASRRYALAEIGFDLAVDRQPPLADRLRLFRRRLQTPDRPPGPTRLGRNRSAEPLPSRVDPSAAARRLPGRSHRRSQRPSLGSPWALGPNLARRLRRSPPPSWLGPRRPRLHAVLSRRQPSRFGGSIRMRRQ